MKKININWKIVLTVLFVIVMWCYWRFEFPALLVFREQVQMFLFNGEYFTQRVIYPAGLARYVAEFLVQFFNNLTFGALIVALVATAMQLLTWAICRATSEKNASIDTYSYYLAFIPVLLSMHIMGNENLNFTFLIAVLFSLLAILGYAFIKSNRYRWAYVIIATPVLYWISGPVVLMLSLYVAFSEIRRKDIILPVFAILFGIAIICLSAFVVRAPFYRLWYGINYTLLVNEILPLQIVIPCCFVIIPFIACYLPDAKKERLPLINILSLVVLALVISFVLPKGVEKIRYEVFEYDCLVRLNQWESIIQKAEKKNPQTMLTVASLNLALAMEGQLIDRGEQFYQNGPQGAFPPFQKFFVFAMMTSEIYFHVGLVNTSQRFAFEAMETIPDNNKSARLIKRLVETNIINGNYDVARKYIKLLKQTMFYAKWAEKQEKMLGDENAINHDPLYGHMREVRLQTDFIFSEAEIDKIMGQLIIQNPQNSVAQQYLLFLPVLEGNQQKFMMYKDFLDKVLRGEINTDTLARGQAKVNPDSVSANARVDGYTSASPQAR